MTLQLDLFHNTETDYLYSEIEKVKHSTDKRCRAIFSLLSELQDQVIFLKNELSKKEENDVCKSN